MWGIYDLSDKGTDFNLAGDCLILHGRRVARNVEAAPKSRRAGPQKSRAGKVVAASSVAAGRLLMAFGGHLLFF